MSESTNIPLPTWACDYAYGDYERVFAALPTRDGRRCGNAFVAAKIAETPNIQEHFIVMTDAGNIMRLTLVEMRSLFYPPEFIMCGCPPWLRLDGLDA